jgi:hypothetical protein
MKREKPAPNGASFSGKSIQGRRPKASDRDTNDQARNRAHLGSTRNDCLRIIMRLVGEGGVPSFLSSQQPALGDCTGAELLQNDPIELLRCLKWLEAQNDGFDEELVGDPDIKHFGRRRRKSQADRVLEILDELENESEI